MVREFFAGVGMLGRGFRFWSVRPGLMALGLVPAAIAFALLAAAFVPLLLGLGGISAWITPFADGWVSPWREVFRTGVGIVVVIAALALAAAVFTALTLAIGDPFYQRIWRGVERHLGDEPTGETGFWTSVGESLRLIVLGIGVALLSLAAGLIPIVGGFAASVLGIVLSGRLLARELAGRAFDARGLTAFSRSELLVLGRARVLGFGVATQLCFLVPLGAVIAMPAAVAGSTLLVRSLLERTPAPRAVGAAPTVAATPTDETQMTGSASDNPTTAPHRRENRRESRSENRREHRSESRRGDQAERDADA